MIDTLLLDYDGFMVDSLDSWREACNDLLTYERFSSKSDFRTFLSDVVNEGGLSISLILKKLGLEDEKHVFFRRKLIDYKPNPILMDELEILNKDFNLAIVSNSFRELIKENLKRYDLLKSFSVIIGLEDIEEEIGELNLMEYFSYFNDAKSGNELVKDLLKPNPFLINLALSYLGKKPENAVFGGDMPSDIQAGKRAGLRTIAANWPESFYDWSKHYGNCKPDYTVNSVEELLEVVRGLKQTSLIRS